MCPITYERTALFLLLTVFFPFEGLVCDDCHKDAACLYGQCICKNGFVGNGKMCKSKYIIEKMLCIYSLLEHQQQQLVFELSRIKKLES